MGRTGRAPGLALAIGFVVVACSGATITPEPRETLSNPPSPSSIVIETPTVTASPSLPATITPQPTPSPVPTIQHITPPPTSQPTLPPEPGKLPLRWINPPGASGLEGLAGIRGSASANGHFVIVGSRTRSDDSCEPTIWWADEPTTWHVAQLPDGYLTGDPTCNFFDVTAGGPGFVALGEGLPLWSTDGKAWSVGSGEAVGNGFLMTIGRSQGGLIAVGNKVDTEGTVARQSADGKTWTSAASVEARVSTLELSFVTASTQLFGFLYDYSGAGKTTIFRVNSADDWQSYASVDAILNAAALGSHGWVAFADHATWLSSNGASWVRGPTSPIGSVQALIADQAGFIASFAVFPAGCVYDESEVVGRTWTSVDGLDWMSQKSFQGRWLDEFFIVNRTITGVGEAHESGGAGFGYVRTADLPPLTQVAAAPTPQVTPTPPQGCG